MTRMNSIHLALAVGAVAVATTGCGRLIERATEEAVEQAIESDSGEDVEIDFSDGEIRVESADGDITFSADEDGVQIDGTDADGNDFSVGADENGLELESEDGTSLDIDGDGTFVATDENGEVITGEADGDGGFTVEGSDGEAVFSSSDEIPEQWPGNVPQPEGLGDITGTYFSEGDDQSIIVTGTVSGDLRDTFDGYTSQLEDAGFEEESTFTQGDDAASSTYVRGEQRISVSIQSLGGTSEMVIALN
jgi:hypothetical protein